LTNKTILFADDSATMRTIMEKTFGAEPYDIVSVSSGEAALSQARDIMPDIIVADAGMAGVSGYDVCQTLRGDPALSGTPVILMAGVSNPYDEAKGDAAGASKYIKKPFDTTELIASVSELIGTSGDNLAPAPVPGPSPAAMPAEREPLAPPSLKRPPDASLKPERPRAVAKPIDPPSKRTMEIGHVSSAEQLGFKSTPEPLPPEPAELYEPEPLEPEEEALYEPEPLEPEEEESFEPMPVEGAPFRAEPEEVEPIQSTPVDGEPIDFDPDAPPDGDAFQVSTLAEMAQMDENGSQVQPTATADAIEIDDSPSAGATFSSVEPPSITASVQQKTQAATSSLQGVSPEQVETIQKLAAEVIEQVVWEVVPDLAEAIIKEELAKLLKE
jgi:CheY-like chemotaxis protein